MAKDATKTETKLKLDPPEALQAVAPAEAAAQHAAPHKPCGTQAHGDDTRAVPDGTPAPSRMEDWQATLITQTLARLDGNVSAAARELGLARNTVYRYLRRGGSTR